MLRMSFFNSSAAEGVSRPEVPGAETIVVEGNGMLPLYRHGDRLIVSEHAPVRVGDRVVLKTAADAPIGGTLIHRDKACVVISQGGTMRKKDLIVDASEVQFMGRVLWASQ